MRFMFSNDQALPDLQGSTQTAAMAIEQSTELQLCCAQKPFLASNIFPPEWMSRSLRSCQEVRCFLRRAPKKQMADFRAVLNLGEYGESGHLGAWEP